MSDVGLFPHLARDIPIWLAVTLILGGAASAATGRALALAWRSFGGGVLYCAALAAASGFLCYALFGVAAIPASFILARLAGGDAEDAGLGLLPWAGGTILLSLIGWVAWRLTRMRQMRRQYPFLFGPDAAKDGGTP